MQACLGCGTAVPEAGRFCPACGSVIGGSSVASLSEPTAAVVESGLLSGLSTGISGAADRGDDRLAADDPSGSLVGCTIGDFAIDGVIGGGSFGTVYRARQLGLDRAVAIKVPSARIAADPVQARRFAREARAAARIVHPGVVAIYAVGELDDGRPYLAMQLIDGEPLDRIFAAGPLPVVRALCIARSIASALAETHAANVVHRDLKPSNIMWRHDRHGDDLITLVDFGIAVCRPGDADATRLTTAGLIGTPHYMSPEQAHGEHVDGRADLYALGCVLYELVTGVTPFEGSGFEVLIAHLGRMPPLASTRNPEIPDVVDHLITQLMAKKPGDRPASADAVVAMIDDALRVVDEPGSAGRGSAPESERGVIDASRSARSSRRAAAPDATTGGTLYAGGGARQGTFDLEPAREPPDRSADASEPELELPRRVRGGRLALAAAAVVALILGAGFAAFRITATGSDEPEPMETAGGGLVSATGEPLRRIARDDGELIVNTLVPEVIHANVAVRAHVEIKTKLGGQFSAKQVVVTVEDPQHRATAQTAVTHGEPGRYAFRHTFAEPGTYVVRIFPSETETVSTIDLDVVP